MKYVVQRQFRVVLLSQALWVIIAYQKHMCQILVIKQTQFISIETCTC